MRVPTFDGHRKHHFDQRYFQTLNTSDKAYWTGFLMADGAIYGRYVSLSLASKDVVHLEKFRAAIGADYPIFSLHKYGTRTHRIQLGSKLMVEDLAAHGVSPRKSFTAIPPCLSRSLERDFWRGMIDGDGSIVFAKDRPTVKLFGSFDSCLAFCEFVDRVCGHRYRISKHKSIFCIEVSRGGHAASLLRLLYDNAVTSLDRKAERARTAMAWIPKIGKGSDPLRRRR